MNELYSSTEDAANSEGEGIAFDMLLDLRRNLKALLAVRCNEDFLTFVRTVAPTLITDFVMGAHIEVICAELQRIVTEKNVRLMFFLPPRSTKSVICSKLFPAWYVGSW